MHVNIRRGIAYPRKWRGCSLVYFNTFCREKCRITLARLLPAPPFFNFNSFLFNWTVFVKKKRKKKSINSAGNCWIEEIRRTRWTLFKNASRLSSFARNNGIVLSLDEDIKCNIMKYFFWDSYIYERIYKKKKLNLILFPNTLFDRFLPFLIFLIIFSFKLNTLSRFITRD